MPPPRIALNACLPPDRLLRVVGELGATLRCLKVSVNAEERDWLKVVTLRDSQFWWARKDLNLGPMDYESTALTAELRALCQRNIDILLHLVNGAGVSRSRSYRSSASSGVSCSFLRAPAGLDCRTVVRLSRTHDRVPDVRSARFV